MSFTPATDYDAIVIGGGHNGLVASAYLAKRGLRVLVLERRHLVGGAAVTEEIIPGFKFSRASYLAGLFRPVIIQDLELEKHGLKYLTRDPSSFTPTPVKGPFGGKHLMLGSDAKSTWNSIAQFSKKDADAFVEYENFLGKAREIIQPLLDDPPPELAGKKAERKALRSQMWNLCLAALQNKSAILPLMELFTGPAAQILDRWFEGDVLKTTLATDAVIGSMQCPTTNGSAYVLLHHVMGEAAGRKGVWAYVQGGMGALSESIASSARAAGVNIATNATVKNILCEPHVHDSGKSRAVGVEMVDGSKIFAKTILSNANPHHTFLELLQPSVGDDVLPTNFRRHVQFVDYSCGALKINCAVDRLPNFECLPNSPDNEPGPQHHGTTHFENFMHEITTAANEAARGIPANRPVIEMTIPSSLDHTLAPPGKHVVQFFVQFAPYHVNPNIGTWADPKFTEAFADRVFSVVDSFCPGFSGSVIGRDILTPLALENIFGLEQGNIFHGAISLHQLAYLRPAPNFSRHRTPVQGLYLCGSGAHPGGGVMGAPGRNAANIVLSDLDL